jgi:hypothetical protein
MMLRRSLLASTVREASGMAAAPLPPPLVSLARELMTSLLSVSPNHSSPSSSRFMWKKHHHPSINVVCVVCVS